MRDSNSRRIFNPLSVFGTDAVAAVPTLRGGVGEPRTRRTVNPSYIISSDAAFHFASTPKVRSFPSRTAQPTPRRKLFRRSDLQGAQTQLKNEEAHPRNRSFRPGEGLEPSCLLNQKGGAHLPIMLPTRKPNRTRTCISSRQKWKYLHGNSFLPLPSLKGHRQAGVAPLASNFLAILGTHHPAHPRYSS